MKTNKNIKSARVINERKNFYYNQLQSLCSRSLRLLCKQCAENLSAQNSHIFMSRTNEKYIFEKKKNESPNKQTFHNIRASKHIKSLSFKFNLSPILCVSFSLLLFRAKTIWSVCRILHIKSSNTNRNGSESREPNICLFSTTEMKVKKKQHKEPHWNRYVTYSKCDAEKKSRRNLSPRLDSWSWCLL